MLNAQLMDSLSIKITSIEWGEYGTWWNFKKVNSPYSRLYLITDGEAFVKHHGRAYRLTRGELHLIPCSCTADYSCPQSFGVYHLTFTSRLAGGSDLCSIQEYDYQHNAGPRELALFKRLLEINPDLKMSTYDPYKPANQIFSRSGQEFLGGADAARLLESRGILLQLLAPILRTAHPETEAGGRQNWRFQHVFNYIEENLARPIHIRELADLAALSSSYFSTLFTKNLGLNPMAYINRRRIERAQMMMLASGKSIKEIANAVGFNSPEYFCRTFKQLCHQTPNQYRSSHPLF